MTLQSKIADAEEYHQQAMDIAERAFAGKSHRSGEVEPLFHEAFELERRAALLISDDLDFEPSRSVLHRSAAALALQCGEIRAAEQLIRTALAGNSPEEIADELRDLLAEVLDKIRHA
jgi:phage shock protein A